MELGLPPYVANQKVASAGFSAGISLSLQLHSRVGWLMPSLQVTNKELIASLVVRFTGLCHRPARKSQIRG